jgi:hypothetical protein
MSYCRWSNNDYECDIYAFASVYGTYEVWVAGSRYVSDEVKPRSMAFPVPGDDEGMKAWFKRNQELNEWISKARKEPIGLPCDGVQFSLMTPGDAADKMEELKAMGYNVPEYAIVVLREEQEEQDKEKQNG